jgi:hypothetical protein
VSGLRWCWAVPPPECVGAGLVVAEAVAVASDVEDDAAVQEPVEQGGRDGGVAEYVAPAGDGQIHVSTILASSSKADWSRAIV